jgi:hypothetical protein
LASKAAFSAPSSRVTMSALPSFLACGTRQASRARLGAAPAAGGHVRGPAGTLRCAAGPAAGLLLLQAAHHSDVSRGDREELLVQAVHVVRGHPRWVRGLYELRQHIGGRLLHATRLAHVVALRRGVWARGGAAVGGPRAYWRRAVEDDAQAPTSAGTAGRDVDGRSAGGRERGCLARARPCVQLGRACAGFRRWLVLHASDCIVMSEPTCGITVTASAGGGHLAPCMPGDAWAGVASLGGSGRNGFASYCGTERCWVLTDQKCRNHCALPQAPGPAGPGRRCVGQPAAVAAAAAAGAPSALRPFPRATGCQPSCAPGALPASAPGRQLRRGPRAQPPPSRAPAPAAHAPSGAPAAAD